MCLRLFPLQNPRLLWVFLRFYVLFSTALEAPLTLLMRSVALWRRFDPLFPQIQVNELHVVDRGDRFAARNAVQRPKPAQEKRQQ